MRSSYLEQWGTDLKVTVFRIHLYPVLQDLAVSWKRHLPLLEVQGDFGSAGNDPAATIARTASAIRACAVEHAKFDSVISPITTRAGRLSGKNLRRIRRCV